jgi:transcriptional regulator with XRE-family HTH domain
MTRQKTEEGIAFGKVLREVRDSRGLTQEQLGELTDLTSESISLYERGLRQPTLKTLLQLAAALEIEPATLVQRVEQRLRS